MFEGHSLTSRSIQNNLRKIKKAKKNKISKEEPREEQNINKYVQTQDSGANKVDQNAHEVRACTEMHVQYVQTQTAKSPPRENITISLSKELKSEMEHYPEIRWSEVAREAFKRKIFDLKGKDLLENEHRNKSPK